MRGASDESDEEYSSISQERTSERRSRRSSQQFSGTLLDARLEDADTRLVVSPPDGADARAVTLGDEVGVLARAHDAKRDRYVLDLIPRAPASRATPPAAPPA
jgi:hypothetical protein